MDAIVEDGQNYDADGRDKNRPLKPEEEIITLDLHLPAVKKADERFKKVQITKVPPDALQSGKIKLNETYQRDLLQKTAELSLKAMKPHHDSKGNVFERLYSMHQDDMVKQLIEVERKQQEENNQSPRKNTQSSVKRTKDQTSSPKREKDQLNDKENEQDKQIKKQQESKIDSNLDEFKQADQDGRLRQGQLLLDDPPIGIQKLYQDAEERRKRNEMRLKQLYEEEKKWKNMQLSPVTEKIIRNIKTPTSTIQQFKNGIVATVKTKEEIDKEKQDLKIHVDQLSEYQFGYDEKECTFHPKINSSRSKSSTPTRQTGTNRSISRTDRTAESDVQKTPGNKQNELEQMFTEVRTRSTSDARNGSRYLELYELGTNNIKKKRDLINQNANTAPNSIGGKDRLENSLEFTFKPEMSQTERKNRILAPRTKSDFYDRNAEWKKEIEKKIKQIDKKAEEELFGQTPHVPRITDYSKSQESVRTNNDWKTNTWGVTQYIDRQELSRKSNLKDISEILGYDPNRLYPPLVTKVEEFTFNRRPIEPKIKSLERPHEATVVNAAPVLSNTTTQKKEQ
ncbi:MAG: hypothetical protein EZS28_010257 [Streblomastix strix]|uniref:Uncharacterized protein n=1 Tax=Streblomastix strix TaxID=222440 RepID=A0A5J4WHB8_9EUKA|nr:MAG: hypothetical protein EZS28_010257 [Streblomastix strix]